MDKRIKKNFYITLVCFLLLIGGSFALFSANFIGQRENQIDLGGLVFRYTEETAGISLDDSNPMSDSDGMIQDTYFDFSVYLKNNKVTSIFYNIYLKEVDGNTMSNSIIKVYLTDQNENKIIEPISFSSLANYTSDSNSKVLYQNIIDVNSSAQEKTHTYRLRAWLDIGTPISNQTTSGNKQTVTIAEKTFSFKVNVKSTTAVNLDGSGANVPQLATGMIPVYYDGSVWRKADNTNTNETYKWYNYDEKMWANAVTVSESNGTRTDLTNAALGTEIPMSRINTMLVWIPRFSASMNGSYNGGTKANPRAFNITFVDTSSTAHDAFDFGGAITGFWISKFEVSTGTTNCAPTDNSAVGEGCNLTTINPYSIPNVASWRGAMVSTFYQAMLGMKDETSIYGFDVTIDTTLDTHMIKNNEWGAVAYLSQSIYGRCTTSTTCTEVGINNNSSFITGYGAPAGSHYLTSNSGYVAPQPYNTNQGMDASTTGNIYGVYDMSGGASDFVMGVYWDGSQYWSGNSSSSHSGFNGCLGGSSCSSTLQTGIAYPSDRKYFNLYTTEDSYTSSGLQHAMVETKDWYRDSANFVNGSLPWFRRGGNYNNSSSAGVFCYDHIPGNASTYYSSRLSVKIN